MNAAGNGILFFAHFYYIVIRSNADATRPKNVSLKSNLLPVYEI
jgi:hypothetical protein